MPVLQQSREAVEGRPDGPVIILGAKSQQARGSPRASLSRGAQVDEVGAGRVAGFQALQGLGNAAQDDGQLVIQFVGGGGRDDSGTVCFHWLAPRRVME